MQPDLSIVLSVYNNEKTVKQAVNSVMENTWGEYSFELIIVDDGSTDTTLSTLKEFFDYENVIVLRKEKNEGTLLSRVDGAKLAHGKFITFMDADDKYIDGIESRLREAFDRDADIIEYDFNYCYKNGQKKHRDRDLPVEEYINPKDQIENIINHKIPVALWHRYYKSELIKSVINKMENNKFRVKMNGNTHDDHFLSPVIFYKANTYIISKQYNYDYTIFSETSVQRRPTSLRQIRQGVLRYKYFLSIMRKDKSLVNFLRYRYFSELKLYLSSNLRCHINSIGNCNGNERDTDFCK